MTVSEYNITNTIENNRKDVKAYLDNKFSLLRVYAKRKGNEQEVNVQRSCDYITDIKSEAITLYAVSVFKKWRARRISQFKVENPNIKNYKSLHIDTALLLIQAMIYASRADGKLSYGESECFFKFYKKILKSDIRGYVDTFLTQNLNLDLLYSKIAFQEERLDIYILSSMMLDKSKITTDSYLENLAATLRIEPSLRKILDIKANEFLETL